MKLSETTTEAIRATAAEKGCRVLAVENTGAGRFSVIRVVLERAGGEPVTVDDCEAVSRQPLFEMINCMASEPVSL